MGQIYQGDIPDVLSAGEYDQGDRVLVYYDDLYDLVHPREKKLCPCCNYPQCGHDHSTNTTPNLSDLKLVTSTKRSFWQIVKDCIGPSEKQIFGSLIFACLWIGVDYLFGGKAVNRTLQEFSTAFLGFYFGALVFMDK